MPGSMVEPRELSPTSGTSILITFAPRSAISMYGTVPACAVEQATTLTPCSGPCGSFISNTSFVGPAGFIGHAGVWSIRALDSFAGRIADDDPASNRHPCFRRTVAVSSASASEAAAKCVPRSGFVRCWHHTLQRPGNFLSKSVANLNEKSLSFGAVLANACTGDQPQVGGG